MHPKNENTAKTTFAFLLLAAALFAAAVFFETKSEKFVLLKDRVAHRDTSWRPLYRACYIASALCFVASLALASTVE